MFPSIDSFIDGKEKVCVVGLGYVGIHVAVNFAKYFKVIGYDKSKERINQLKEGIDLTREFAKEEIISSGIEFTSEPKDINKARFVIIAVPTPVTRGKIPDLSFVESACETVGKNIQKGSYVILESTVYPGVTEEICVPILEKFSGLKAGEDFKVGYSPERVNPGDKDHTFDKVVKVVSGQDRESTEFIAKMYSFPVKAGVYVAKNIKTAEAAKVIENIQRDLNVALMNELSVIFHLMGVDTKEVLEAASTKWNFLKFEPGLVGGHCISVDPYYLAFRAQEFGYHPEVILAGRRINNGMGKYVAENTVKLLIKAGKAVRGSRVLIMGITFKENIPDTRESKVIDIYEVLVEYGANVDVVDPCADPEEVKKEFNIFLLNGLTGWEEFVKKIGTERKYDAVIIAVKHKPFYELDINFFKGLLDNRNPVIVDVKGIYSRELFEKENFLYWRL